LWLYIVPIVIAGAIGSRHIHEIAPALLILFQELDFANAAAYLREWVAKPLLMVVFALLAGAAVAKSARPEKWLIPVIISMCVMRSEEHTSELQSQSNLVCRLLLEKKKKKKKKVKHTKKLHTILISMTDH